MSTAPSTRITIVGVIVAACAPLSLIIEGYIIDRKDFSKMIWEFGLYAGLTSD